MKIISTSYNKSPAFSDPWDWLNHIRFYTSLLEALSKNHMVISIERIDYTGDLHHKGVWYHFIKLKNTVARFPVRMHEFIRAQSPDVVLVNGFIFPLQLLHLRRKLGKEVSIIVLHRAERPFKGYKKWLQVLASKQVDAFLFSSAELAKEWLEQRIIREEKKLHEVMQSSSIFYPLDKKIARLKLKLEGKTIFLWVGRLEKNKDPLTVVRGFTAFLEKNTKARLYMIFQQDDLLAVLQDWLKKHQQQERIILAGKQAHEDLQDWYSAADFIISGSHAEGSGIAVIEAMSCGCIPILTDIPSFRKLSGNGRFGLLYEAGNEKALLRQLEKTEELDRELLSREVYQQFHNEFSPAAIADKITSIIQPEGV